MALSDWQLTYNVKINKWEWRDTRVFKDHRSDPPAGRNKNGFFPFEFNFLEFIKGDVSQCYLCGVFRKSRKLTRDHIYPKSLGGDKTAPACRTCNESKLNMRPIEWAIFAAKKGLDVAVIPQGYDPVIE